MSRKWFAAAMLLVLLLAGLLSLPARADSGYALSFDGQSNYVALGDTGQLMSNDTWISAKTVSAWVRPTGETTTSLPPTSGEFIAGTDRPRIFGISRADHDGGDRLWVWNIAADGLAAVGIPFTVGEWVHVALVHDGETLHAYRNGVLVGSVPTGPTNLPREDIDGSLYLGGLARNDPSLNIQGDIDEVRFWNRALSAAEIQDWMSQELTADHAHIESLAAYYPMSDGAGTTLSDDSGNGHTGSLEGGMGDASWVLSDAFGESEATPTNTPDAPTPTPSNTPTPTNTATPTNTPEPPTPTPSNTPTNTPDAPTPTPSNTPTNTPEPPTPTPSNTPTSTPDAPTPTPTNTPAPPTPTPTSSASGGDPVEVGFYETAGDAYDLALVGNTVYVADVAGGLRIIDVTDPAAPQELGFHETPRKAYGVAADAAYAYVAVGAQGIRIYDVTNPANPVEVGAFDTPSYAWDLEVGGDFLYVADRWSGFHIIDVSERTALVHVAAVSTPDEALSLAIDGDYAYVAAYTSGLRIVDISDPANAHEVASAAAGRAYGVTVSDGYAYVAGGGEGLCLVDVATPTQPVQLGCHNTDGWSRSVSVTGDYAYLADWTGGFRVIDVSDPANPLQSGFHDTTGRPRDVIVSGGYAYVAAYEGGLRILRI